MKATRILKTLLIAAGFVAQGVFAQVNLREGQDYLTLSPAVPTENKAKIEVTEYFSYACIHCKDFHPLISKWAEKLPADVVLRRVALPGRAFYTLTSKAYYTLEALGETKRLDAAMFAAANANPQGFTDEKSLFAWVGKQGLDEKKFAEAFKSFAVDSKVRQADKLAAAAKISNTPSIVVDGRYLVRNPKTFPDLLAKTDWLVAKRRAERRK